MVPVLIQVNPVSIIPFYFLSSTLLLSSHQCLGQPCGLFPSGFSPKLSLQFSFLPCMLLTSPIMSSTKLPIVQLQLQCLCNLLFFHRAVSTQFWVFKYVKHWNCQCSLPYFSGCTEFTISVLMPYLQLHFKNEGV